MKNLAPEISLLSRGRILLSVNLLLLVLCLAWSIDAQDATVMTNLASEKSEPAPLIFENREVMVFRATVEKMGPEWRAARAKERLEKLEMGALYQPVKMIITNLGTVVSIGGNVVFGIFPGDLDPESGETMEQAAAKVQSRLQEAVSIRLKQRNPEFLLQVALKIGVATLIFVVLIGVLVPIHRFLVRVFERSTERRRHRFQVLNFDLLATVLAILRFLTLAAFWTVVIVLAYLWLQYCLGAYPYTQPWGEAMGSFLWKTLKTVAIAVLKAFPNLLMVLIIFLITRFVAGLARNFFDSVETGQVKAPAVLAETSAATRRLANFFIWLFGLAIAYPYLPGAQTDAFKGISVFAGLIFTIGSSGVVNHLMSGLVLVYARALKVGDFVRVGDIEGTVTEMGALSTRIVTRLREEFSIPNTVMVGSTIQNYTRMATGDGLIVSTTVTIGYDAPWRQIHALLLEAAERTGDLKKDPKPFVVQTALSDFYVEYKLCGHISQPETRVRVLSELHTHIQDAFNEHGVQIMSPHFESQPEQPVWVEKSKWYAAPARPPGNEQKD